MTLEPHPTKQQIIELMRRMGLQDWIPEAQRDLPDIIDLDRDGAILSRIGLGVDEARNALGGSP
jgi:hypothetical protein